VERIRLRQLRMHAVPIEREVMTTPVTNRVWQCGIDDRKRIWLKTDSYDPRVVSGIKNFLPTPRTWSKNEGLWYVPLMWETCVALRQLAKANGADLDIAPALRDWATEERDRLASVPDPNAYELPTDTQLTRLAEFVVMATALESRSFQQVGVKFVATAKKVLIADDPGLGKTLQTLAGVIEAGTVGPILVVAAPKSAAVITWPNELKKWLPNETVITISGKDSPTEREKKMELVQMVSGGGVLKATEERIWVITSPNYLRFKADLDQYGNYTKPKTIRPVREALQGMIDITWSAVIVDESHKTLACATNNRKKWSAQRVGLDCLKVADGGLKIALSGTPFRGKKENAWGTIQFLRPDLFRGYWKWAEKYFEIYTDGFGQIIGGLKDEEAFYGSLKSMMIRRTKAEVAADLPPKQYGGAPLDPADPDSPVGVWLDMEGAQKKAYEGMVKNASATLEGGTLTANGVLAELTRLKQFACSAGKLNHTPYKRKIPSGKTIDDVDVSFVPSLPSNKFDWLVDFLSERGIGGDDQTPTGKVIVASQFTKLLNVFRAGLEELCIPSHILTGETSEAERIRQAEVFQAPGGPSVFFLNTNAGGASITLDAADDVVILDQTWNMDDQQQVEDRAHRLSRTDHQVTIWNVLSRNTIEEGIAINNLQKDFSIKSVLDGQRGIELVQQLVRGSM
jgi:SNF2 family DNA or RNA helicase